VKCGPRRQPAQEGVENRSDRAVGCTLPAQQAVPPHRMNSHRNRVNRWEFITTLCSAATTDYVFKTWRAMVSKVLSYFTRIVLSKSLDIRYLWYMLILIFLNKNTNDLH
jgi:hypothetical protein